MGLQGDLLQVRRDDPLQKLLQERIGYGPAQQKLLTSIYLLLFSQGLLLPHLQLQWGIGIFHKSLIITVVYFGVTVGSYVQTLSDTYGRHTFIGWDAVLQSFFGLLSCVCPTFNTFVITRFFYGVGIGICLPLSASYIAEITPSSMRATILSRSRVYWSAGALTTVVLAWAFGEHWRMLVFVICLPGVYAIYEHMTVGKESLRYLWVNCKHEEVCQLIQFMARSNGKESIPREQIIVMMEEKIKQQHVEGTFRDMLNEKYYKSTYRLLMSWFTVCFVYYGVMLLLPTILARNYNTSPNFKYVFLIVITTIEVISFWTSSKAMDHPSIGRKKAVYWGFGLIFVSTVVVVVGGEGRIVILMGGFAVIKFVVTSTFMVLYPYTTEIYETKLRGRALGILSMVGRIATMILGVTGPTALELMGGNGLYFIFIVLSAIAAWGAYSMPYCTRGKPLDT